MYRLAVRAKSTPWCPRIRSTGVYAVRVRSFSSSIPSITPLSVSPSAACLGNSGTLHHWEAKTLRASRRPNSSRSAFAFGFGALALSLSLLSKAAADEDNETGCALHPAAAAAAAAAASSPSPSPAASLRAISQALSQCVGGMCGVAHMEAADDAFDANHGAASKCNLGGGTGSSQRAPSRSRRMLKGTGAVGGAAEHELDRSEVGTPTGGGQVVSSGRDERLQDGPVILADGHTQQVAQFDYTYGMYNYLWGLYDGTASRLYEWSLMVSRTAFLAATFTPTLVTLPLFLFSPMHTAPNNAWWDILRFSIRQSGPCTIKFAQWLATRPDILPLRYCNELQELQTNANDHGFDVSLAIVKRSLGENVIKDLQIVEESLRVIGNGCVAQVVMGSTVQNQLIAIKVVHPGIRTQITSDIRILRHLTWLVEACIPGAYNWSLVDSVDEFGSLMLSQLDMVEEGRRLDRFRYNFHHKYDQQQKSERRTRKGEEKCVEFDDDMKHTASVSARTPDVDDKQVKMTPESHARQQQQQQQQPKRSLLKRIVSSVLSKTNSTIDAESASHVIFPKPLWPYVSPDVLVETFESGVPCSEVLSMCERDGSKNAVGASLASLMGTSNGSGAGTMPGVPLATASLSTSATATTALLSDAVVDAVDSTTAQAAAQCKEIAALGLHTVLKMIFEDNFVHGDMHPGNILIRCRPRDPPLSSQAQAQALAPVSVDAAPSSPSSPPVVEMVILDAGIVSELSLADKRNLFDLFKAIARNGGDEAARLMIQRSAWNSERLAQIKESAESAEGAAGRRQQQAQRTPTQGSLVRGRATIRDPDVFCAEVKGLVNEIHTHGLAMGRISIGSLLERMLTLCRRHNVKLDAKFIQVIVAIGIVEGLGRRLDPSIDLLGKAIPYIVKAAVADSVECTDAASTAPAAASGGASKGTPSYGGDATRAVD